MSFGSGSTGVPIRAALYLRVSTKEQLGGETEQ